MLVSSGPGKLVNPSLGSFSYYFRGLSSPLRPHRPRHQSPAGRGGGDWLASIPNRETADHNSLCWRPFSPSRLFGIAAAGPLEDGQTAYQRGDYAAAIGYWRPLAEEGHATAHGNLGVMYANGQGVPQDYAQAHMWFNLAASRLPSSALRSKAVEGRDAMAAKMTPDQIAEAQRLAREWKPTK